MQDLKKLTSLSNQTLHRELKEGTLRGYQARKGTAWIFSKETVEKFVASLSEREPTKTFFVDWPESLLRKIEEAASKCSPQTDQQSWVINAIEFYISYQKKCAVTRDVQKYLIGPRHTY